MRTLTYYYSEKSDDPKSVYLEVKELCEKQNIPCIDICIDNSRDLQERFTGKTPTILIGPYRINSPFEIREIEIAINAVQSKDKADSRSENVDPKSSSLKFSRFESFSLWFSRSYVWVISIFLVIFVGVAFLAPVFEMNGKIKTSSGIYKVYSILCHQLAYRSYFIGGEQLIYPRELADINRSIMTYEDATGKGAEDLAFAREFIGNSALGFKVALCERDVAIYLSMALFGILFQLTGKKIKGLPWYLWFVVALIPIALDGGTQLPSLAEGWPAWFPIRESTPLLRTLTGALFGAGTAWYIFPLMEETVSVSRFNLERKSMIIKKIKSQVAK